jgi:hypothetical protein
MGEFEDEIRARLEGNIIPFKPIAPEVSKEYPSPAETGDNTMPRRPKLPTKPIAVLDDERQRRFMETLLPAAEPMLCGTPLLDGGEECRAPNVAGRSNWPLLLLAYAFAALGIGINIWNAAGGALTDMALPAAMGVLAEGLMSFLPAHAITLPLGRRALAFALLVGLVVPFALFNSLRMASILSADVALARADRTTAAVRDAEAALADARIARDKECIKVGPLCRQRQDQVLAAEGKLADARRPVAAVAKPEAKDFARLVTWATRGYATPSADDFDMFWLLFRTLLPQIGGLVKMLARR